MSSPVARSEALKGARFGAHEIVGLLGHGATASVFEGKHVALAKPVAVKILHEHLAQDEQIAGRFLREGRIAARMRHPNIVEVFDVGVEHGLPYLVMERLHGSDLHALLADTERLDVEHALAFLLPIASALVHAHEAGVVHRDLKPANIFLARDVRDDVIPKLVDFGLSKAAGFHSDSLTRSELVAGTLLYMAPEQTVGVKFATAASDQYSLAAILYECITGVAPFVAEGIYALIDLIRTTKAKLPSAIAAAVSPELDAVVLRALDRDPAARWPSVRDFARELLPFASTETANALARDFSDRASARGRGAPAPASGPSRTSARTAVAPAETRIETSERAGVPPLPCAPGTSPFHIKGNPYRGLAHFLTTKLPGGLDAFCDALDDARLRDFVRQPFLATSRYDVLPFYPLSATLARVVGAPFDTFVRAATASQARYDARTAYKRIFEGTGVMDIPERIARFNGHYYDFGEFIGEVLAPDRFTIEFRSTPAYLFPWFGLMNVAYTEESARIGGAKEVNASLGAPRPVGETGGFALVTFTVDVTWR